MLKELAKEVREQEKVVKESTKSLKDEIKKNRDVLKIITNKRHQMWKDRRKLSKRIDTLTGFPIIEIPARTRVVVEHR